MLVCAHLGALRAVKLQKGGEAKGKQESQEGLAAPPLCFLLGGLGGAACGFQSAKKARRHGGWLLLRLIIAGAGCSAPDLATQLLYQFGVLLLHLLGKLLARLDEAGQIIL